MVQPYVDAPAALRRPVAWNILALVSNMVSNPEYSIPIAPESCSGDNCTSYLITGGLSSTTPWPPTGYDDSPVVQIWNALAVQVDYSKNLGSQDSFTQDDCVLIGDPGSLIGMAFCLTQSKTYPGSYASGKSSTS
jgi:hypothetical protein